MNNISTFSPGYYEGETIKALLRGEAQRTEDQIQESYAELCFFADYLYGYPGLAVLDAAVREKGLDAALDDLPEGQGEQIRQALHSPDYHEYLIGLNDLISYGFSDGHTVFMTLNAMLLIPDFQDVVQPLVEKMRAGLMTSMGNYQAMIKRTLEPTRQQLWGDDTYREYGKTAIIRIDGFNPDEAGWAAWKDGTGEMPMDALALPGPACRRPWPIRTSGILSLI